MSQLPLPLRWAPEYDLDAFFFADQSLARMLRALVQSNEHRALLLVGPSNSGKSYLLRALAAARFGSHLVDHASGIRPEGASMYCFDGLDSALGDAGCEEWLFHDFNHALDTSSLWLATAREAPANLPITLPDLRSRLMQATLIMLPAIHDENARHAMLRQQAAGMGVALEDGVLSYLETHVSRDLSKLSQWLRRLNDYSLGRGRKITAAAVRELKKIDAQHEL